MPDRRRSTDLVARIPLVVADWSLVAAAYAAALVLRFDGHVPSDRWRAFLPFAPLAATAFAVACASLGLYGAVWRYAGVREARRLAVAALAASAASLMAWVVARPLPLSVAIAGAALAPAGPAALRFRTRLLARGPGRLAGRSTRLLIVGTGDAGESIVRDILRNDASDLRPVAFVHAEHRTDRGLIHGIPVVGDIRSLPRLIAGLRVDKVLVAEPAGTADVYRSVFDVCDVKEIPVVALPSLRDVVGGSFTVRDIRGLRIEDFVGREPVPSRAEAVSALLGGRRVLVTGAGGSIGSEIARQVACAGPAALVLLDNDETHLHEVVLDLPHDARVVQELADVRDRDRVDVVFATHRPEVVFHAAALKHVPILESCPAEAVKTNVVGTINVADAALRQGVATFVLVSTDKAVNPVSAMGASKRIAERVVASINGRGSAFCAVRFANVLGSRGSVVPTFLRQIERGGPVTVTHPAMTRYFMTTSEAVELVVQAAALARGGEIFTLDMGEAVSILALARRVIRLAGRSPVTEVPITFTGIRPGERLTETPLSPEEHYEPTPHLRVLRSAPAPEDRAHLRRALESVVRACETESPDGIRAILLDAARGAQRTAAAELVQTDGAQVAVAAAT